METVSLNNNPSTWNDIESTNKKLCFMNARSIKNKFHMIKSDRSLQMAEIIFISETWLEDEDPDLILPGYYVCFNCGGRGGGTAVYFKGNYLVDNLNLPRVNATLLSSSTLDVFGIYRSNDGDLEVLLQYLTPKIRKDKNIVIGGDFNIDYHKDKENIFSRYLLSIGFKQVVTKATHIQGGIIDHVYLRLVNQGTFELEMYSKTYTDHDSLNLILKL